jgi:PAS domain S-box-containing protein
MSNFKQTGSEPRDRPPDFEERVAERSQPFEDERDFVSSLLGIVGAAVIVTDARGVIVWVNKSCAGASGYPAAGLHGRYIWDLAPPADRETARRYFERILSGGLTVLGTEQRLPEEQARERQASLERAVALAHDLSQPLEAIGTYAQAGLLQLRKRPFDPDKLTDNLEKIATQVRSAAEILRDVRESR